MGEILVHQIADGRVGVVTLNRPDQLNALTIEGYEAAADAVRDLDTADVSVIVMRSSSGNFCTGGDLGVIDGAAAGDKLAETMEIFNVAAYKLFSALDETSATVVSAVRGHCLAGGLIISLLSDIVIADETARFGVPEGRVGIGDPFVPARLPQRIGDLRAREMILAGRVLDASTAAEWGLVTSVTSAPQLEGQVELALERVLELSKFSRSWYRSQLSLHRSALKAAPEASTDPETVEGVNAFKQRRRPNWVTRHEEGWYEQAVGGAQ